jgi:hypothetical protein
LKGIESIIRNMRNPSLTLGKWSTTIWLLLEN